MAHNKQTQEQDGILDLTGQCSSEEPQSDASLLSSSMLFGFYCQITNTFYTINSPEEFDAIKQIIGTVQWPKEIQNKVKKQDL